MVRKIAKRIQGCLERRPGSFGIVPYILPRIFAGVPDLLELHLGRSAFFAKFLEGVPVSIPGVGFRASGPGFQLVQLGIPFIQPGFHFGNEVILT